MSKTTQLNEFMSDLDSYVKKVAAEAVGKQHDSCHIYHTKEAKQKMEKSLKTLLDIP